MKATLIPIALLILLGGPAFADPWKDESGHGRWWSEHRDIDVYGREDAYRYDYPDNDDEDYGYRRDYKRHYGDRRDYKRHYAGREYKEEFWAGGCKIERKWERNGKYKEERKCD